ncbi:class II aldolase/adducin family protein [Brucella pecoris]|nr:class II aldolase/adducin family protein [Brucella pecoris]MBB4096131.1 rhamnose utilization protein RhaD (predicted bifunctional aldolase and dehydrogenase) [Brucella pecoris]
MKTELLQLAAISRRLGADVSFVQGGGGNTSLKMNDSDLMYIKASGINLDAIEANTGFLAVDKHRLINGLRTCRTEADYNNLLMRCLLEESETHHRPSIESGFHALLGECVVHSHSIWANILTCSVEGRDLLARTIPEAVWVDYATPGLPLTLAITDHLELTETSIIFLQNHGLVISADTPEAAYALHAAVNEKARALFPSLPVFPLNTSGDFHDEGLLFPDQAVYQYSPELSASIAGHQTAQAYSYLLHAIPAVGLTLNFIEDAEKAVLVGMESEKHRQKVAQT